MSVFYVPSEQVRPSRDILKNPEIAKYVQDWGRIGDEGFLAISTNSQQPIGAPWYRLFKADNKAYGYVDDETPELSIAVAPQYRGKGIGHSLMVHILEQAKLSCYYQIYLSVAPDNPTTHLYGKLGFEKVGVSGTSLIMKLKLSGC
jgi:ribosomal protein S18 acetylase RimI-like enzyme